MLTYIGIISLIILIIAIYQYKNNVIPEDNIEGFSYHNWSLKARNIPQNWQKNTAYLRVFADDYLHIYHNKGNKSSGITGKSPWKNTTWVGQARCCGKMYNFDIENFNPGDSLMFYSYNSGGPGYWGGYVFLNNKWFTFNRSTVRISAYQTQGDIYRKTGKYLGCYRDGHRRRLPYYGSGTTSFEGCQEIAIKRNHRYFGLQYGGQCWTGTNGSRAKSYGRVHDYYCRNKYARARNWSWGERVKRWTQSYGLGGWWTNSLHDTYRTPDIDYYGEFGYRWHRNGNTPKQPSAHWRGHTYGLPRLYRLKAKNASRWRQHSLYRWIQFQFINPTPATKLDFCPDKRYTEFNAAGCADPSNTNTCMNSVYPNYRAKMSECHHRFRVDGNHYDNADFYKIVGEALSIAKKAKWKNFTQFKNEFLHTSNLACSILGNKNINTGIGYNESECKSRGGAFDMVYLNEIIYKARTESDKHAMGNGKTANNYLRKELDSAVINLTNEAREVLGRNADQCKCKDFTSKGPTCKPC